MSQSQTQTQQSPYRRDNWWGENSIDDRERAGHDPEPFRYQRERAEWVAHKLLKAVATLACPIALNAPPNRPAALWEWLERGEADSGHDPTAMHRDNIVVELTEPRLWLRLETSAEYGGRTLEYGQRTHRTRVNPEHGYPVGPQILDVEFDLFMTVVNSLLDHFQAIDEVGLSDRERDTLQRDAERLKKAGDRRDTEILATIIRDATGEGPIIEDT